jgi:hypothetical protein
MEAFPSPGISMRVSGEILCNFVGEACRDFLAADAPGPLNPAAADL